MFRGCPIARFASVGPFGHAQGPQTHLWIWPPALHYLQLLSSSASARIPEGPQPIRARSRSGPKRIQFPAGRLRSDARTRASAYFRTAAGQSFHRAQNAEAASFAASPAQEATTGFSRPAILSVCFLSRASATVLAEAFL